MICFSFLSTHILQLPLHLLFATPLLFTTYAWQPDSAVRRISLMPTIYNFQEALNTTGIGQHHFLFDDIMEDLGSAMQVVSVIKLRQERCELGRTFTLRDIKRAVLEVGEREGHFSPRWIRWCICNHFDMVDNILCPYYGCYRFKQFWPAPLFFVNTDQIPLPILYSLCFDILKLMFLLTCIVRTPTGNTLTKTQEYSSLYLFVQNFE